MKNNVINFNLDNNILKLIDTKKTNIINYNKNNDLLGNLTEKDIVLFDLDKKCDYKKLLNIINKKNGVLTIGLVSPSRVRIATKLLKDGLTDYIAKSTEHTNKDLAIRIEHFVNFDKKNLSKTENSEVNYIDIFNSSSKLRKTFNNLVRIANTNIPILIQGEQGCNHSSYAKAIHNLSNRKDNMFLEIFCPTLTVDNIENILFAKAEKINKGTVFFENIDLLDKKVQNLLSKLVEINGLKYDIRIISSTTKNLKEETRNGNFREDLYFLFNGSCLTIPALRETRNVIPIIVKNLYKYYALEENKIIKGITNKALKILENYDWPGNIKEIKTVIHKAVVLTNKEILDEKDFLYLKNNNSKVDLSEEYNISIKDSGGNFKTMEALEKEIIDKYLKINNGNITEVAKLLNLGRTTLYRKLEDENS